MSSTSLVQRLPSASTVKNSLTPSSSRNTLSTYSSSSSSRDMSRTSQQNQNPNPSTTSSALATATSLLPKLNLTPQKSTTPTPGTPQQQPSPAYSTPGQWQHPRMQEVIQRQNATRFDASNMRVIGMNAGFLVASVLAPLLAWNVLPRAYILAAEPYSSYALNLLRLFFAVNIILAFTPLFRPRDACDDIPLTDSQRQLMGLGERSRPATPMEELQYVTPPRYSRSGTPQSGSSLRAQPSGSPLSGRGTPLSDSLLGGGRSVSGSPRPSPLAGMGGRRSSFQSSPLGTPEFDAAGSMSTPTKSNKASVGLNSKWLYRHSPRTSFSGLGGFGGGGSVFQ